MGREARPNISARPGKESDPLQRKKVHDLVIIPKPQPRAWTYRILGRQGKPLILWKPMRFKRWLDEPDELDPPSKPMLSREYLKTTLQEMACQSIKVGQSR
jgi:hypothetical protein